MWRNWQTRRFQVPVGFARGGSTPLIRILSCVLREEVSLFRQFISNLLSFRYLVAGVQSGLLRHFARIQNRGGKTFHLFNENHAVRPIINKVVPHPLRSDSRREGAGECLHGLKEDMFEIARQLEQAAVCFNPVVLIVPGLATVLLGLFVWLGGLGFRKVLVAIVGAASGGICGFFISGQNIVPAAISAGLAAVVAVVLERIFIAILAGVLAAILGFAVLAGPYIANAGGAASVEWDKTQKLSTQQSVERVEVYIARFAAETEQIFSRMLIYERAIIAVLAVIFLAAGFFLQRLTSAFCCAALGTILIFAGMILLLLYKGAAPVSRICQNQLYYLGVFAAMTAFGMAEQLLLCERIKEKLTGRKQKSKNGREPETVSENWRGR